MSAFVDSLDIGNRALDHLGLPHILAVDEDSARNSTIAAAYDKLREAELERNIWKFAKRKVYLRPLTADSRVLAPAQWNENETYLPGSIVADVNGDLWTSWKADNYGNEPGVTDAWDSYFGPMAIDKWADGASYFPGELVYKELDPGTFAIFLSTKSGNSDDPATSVAWDAETTYGLNDRVTYGGSSWRSLITLNTGVTPADVPAAWAEGSTYDTDDQVLAGDGFIYTALSDGILDIDPLDDDGTFWTKGVVAGWSRDPTLYEASPNWLPIFSNMTNLGSEYLYVAMGSQANVYRAPAGALRMARIGYRSRNPADDYEPHGDYITSGSAVMLREFVANIRDVRKMDAMFCEGLAVRIALSTCKKLTGSSPDVGLLASEYTKFMNEARTINGIEMGPEEPDEDEYITVRTGGTGGAGYSNASTNWWN